MEKVHAMEEWRGIAGCEGCYQVKCIHRLVAEAFIPNDDGRPQVNHIDGDKANNAVENLE